MAKAENNAKDSDVPQLKIRGRVLSTEKPVSKIRERVFSTEEPVSKMAQLLAGKHWEPRPLTKGEPVEGKIAAILNDLVLVDIGAKAEGIIPRRELADSGEKIEIGAKVNAVVAQTEGDSGTAVLTVKKAVIEKVWTQLEKLVEDSESVEVKVVGGNRGGSIAEYKGVRGFVPSSHLVTGTKNALGQSLTVKVLQVNRNFNKLVFSEREATGDAFPKVELPFKAGDTLKVKVSKILNFGLLVSLPSGSDGLIHISEISWKKVSDLAVSYKVGQELSAKVISIDPNTGKVNLSIKQLEVDPWQEAAKKYKVGATFEKPVSRTTSYGVFIKLEEGIEGLLHSSKIPYGVELKSGDKLNISIDLFDSEQRRVALRLAPDAAETDNKDKEAEKKETTKVKSSKAKETDRSTKAVKPKK